MSNQFKFDPNQNQWPSEAHKAVWQWGLYIMPEEITLTNQIRELMDDELYESCRQMRQFLLHSLSVMYERADEYDATGSWNAALKYLGMWYGWGERPYIKEENLGKAFKNNLSGKKADLEKNYGELFERTGVVLTQDGGTLEVSNTMYPQMFLAMEIMNEYSRKKREEFGGRNSFYMCDFRRICPGYKGKPDKVDDIARWLLSGEILFDFEQFLGFLRNEGMRFTKGWKDHRYGIKYKGEGIAGVGIEGPNRVCFGVGVGRDYDLYLDGQPQEVVDRLMFRVNKYKCTNCRDGRTECSKSLGRTVTIAGKEYKNRCVGAIGDDLTSVDGDMNNLQVITHNENDIQFMSLEMLKTLILAMKAYVDKTK